MLLLSALGFGVAAAVILARLNPLPPTAGTGRKLRRWGLGLLTAVAVGAMVAFDDQHLTGVIGDPILVVLLLALYRQPREDEAD